MIDLRIHPVLALVIVPVGFALAACGPGGGPGRGSVAGPKGPGAGAAAAPGTIFTLAGTGEEGQGPPGAQGTATALAFPSGVGLDAGGRLLIADFKNHRVLRVGPGGVIERVAGTGVRGFSGDGGPATEAELSFPCGVAHDGQGGVLIADTNNQRIRRVRPDGIIETVVSDLRFPESIAEDGEGGFYLVEAGAYRLSRWTPGAGLVVLLDQGLASPYDVALHPDGRVLVADYGGQRVLAYLPDGGAKTVAGTGRRGFSGDGGPAVEAELAGPQGVAVGAEGAIYIADTGNHRIRRVAVDGRIETVAGTGEAGFSGDGGPAAEALLAGPAQVAVDAAGGLYVADAENHRIRAILPPDAVVEPFPGAYRVAGASGTFQGEAARTGAGADGPGEESGIELRGTVSFEVDGGYVADLVVLEDGEPNWLSAGGFTRFEGSYEVEADLLILQIPLWGVEKRFTWSWEEGSELLRLRNASPEGAIPLIHGDLDELTLRREGRTP